MCEHATSTEEYLRAALIESHAKLAEAFALLKFTDWKTIDRDGIPKCVHCRNSLISGHASDCKLDAFLSENQ